MLKVKIGLRGLNPNEKVEKAQRVASGMSESTVYSKNRKLIEELISAQIALSKAIEMAEYGDRRAIAARNLCVKNLDAKLRQAASYVEAFSNGNREEVEKSGFELRKRNNQPKPLANPDNFRIKRTDNEGELILSWSPVKNSKNYLVQSCTNESEKDRNWMTISYSTKSRCLVDNLEPGKRYYFRVLAIGAGGIGPPSTTESIMAA
ncbi:MAG: fibronectin type III domain-containing protein [Flavobacteriales bacterium]|nr:fibronectin type III domain-containing protein [Flavobacteriales bacterium]